MAAQFQSASVTDNSTSNGSISPAARTTGNDILDFGGDTYAVSVWDDAIPILKRIPNYSTSIC